MGVGLGLAIGALIVGVIAAIMFRPSTEGQDMSPASLESFQITTTDEGSVVPWICGDVRIKSNLIWYGNLASVAITQEAGKGGGSDVTTGYQYWMDLWHSVCLGGDVYGNVSLQGVYVGDKEVDLGDITYELNDGTQSTYPDEPGQYASPLKKVAHIFLPQYYLGENVSFVPTFHWIMRCTSNAPITHPNLSNGVNPAARIYDILRVAGAAQTDFDVDSFDTAGEYWYNQGYGINLTYSQQKEARELVAEVFNYVDGCLRKDNEDKWVLRAYDPNDTPVATFNEEDLIEFNLTRRSWAETYNDFRGNFTDATQAYTRRTVRVYNGASQRLLGYKRQKTVDLTAFRDVTTASKRLAEIMRRLSYPEAQISWSADLRFEETCHVGEIVIINNDEYSMSNAYYRITNREVNEYNSNLLDFHAVQVVEKIWQTTYQTAGAAGWTDPDYRTVEAPHEQAIYEMPPVAPAASYPQYILLCARQNQEDRFKVLASPDGTDYEAYHVAGMFSQYGTLDEVYPNSLTTDSIDDDYGILYTPTREDPVFPTISRSQLFTVDRLALIGGTELVMFQTVTYEGANSIRLTGVVRGALNTEPKQHSAGASIWLFYPVPNDNLLIFPYYKYSKVKYLPGLGSVYIDSADALSALTVSYVGRLFGFYQPDYVPTVHITRSGSSITVLFFVRSWYGNGGAGYESTDLQQYDGDYNASYGPIGGGADGNYVEYRISGGTVQTTVETKIEYIQAGQHYLYMRMRNYQDWTTCLVPAADGEYVFPQIAS